MGGASDPTHPDIIVFPLNLHPSGGSGRLACQAGRRAISVGFPGARCLLKLFNRALVVKPVAEHPLEFAMACARS